MSAPDKNVVAKPLHERIAEYFSWPYVDRLKADADDLLREAAAELSRMRTALEEIRAMRPDPDNVYGIYARAMYDAFNQCAAIAERALTAGSGNE